MLSVLILEDDYYTLRFLEKLTSSHSLVEKVFPASGGEKAILVAEKSHIDIAFLDIELSSNDSCSGIEVAKSLKAMQSDLIIIFVTGYTHYAINCFSVHPYDYIVKPINKAKVMDTITEVASIKNNPLVNDPIPKRNIALKVGNKLVYIVFEDIFFIEKIGKKAFIHTSDEILTCNHGLLELAVILPDYFKRTHKSYVVNMKKIRSIENLGNQSFVINFTGYGKTAYLSRYEYEKEEQLFRCDLRP